MKTESDKRDYEAKLFEQEKEGKEKEVARLKEDLEQRTYQWDNQIRSLLLQKSVQDSEYDAERLRTDRESRTALRALEARREELRQRLNDIKARHAALDGNAKKEIEVIGQRWTVPPRASLDALADAARDDAQGAPVPPGRHRRASRQLREGETPVGRAGGHQPRAGSGAGAVS